MAGDKDQDKYSAADLSAIIGNLPDTIGRFWSGVAYPLFELAITLIVMFFALGLDRQFDPHKPLQLNLVPNESVKNALEFYGLTLVIPVALVIVLLGIAQANSNILRAIGRLTPGELVPNTTDLLVSNADLAGILAIWHCHPTLNRDLNALNVKLDAEVARIDESDANRSTLASARGLKLLADGTWNATSFVKGLLVVTVVMALSAWFFGWRLIEPWRLGFLAAVALIVLAQYAARRIYWSRIYAAQKVSDYVYYLRLTEKLKDDSVKPQPEDLKRLLSMRTVARREGVWKLRFFPSGLSADYVELFKSFLPRNLFRWRQGMIASNPSKD